MNQAGSSKLFEYVDRMGEIQKRMTHIFLGSLTLSALVTFDLAYISVAGGALGTVIRVLFPGLLLWSLVITAYAFYTLWRVSSHSKELLEDNAVCDPRTGAKSVLYMKKLIRKEFEWAVDSGCPASLLHVRVSKVHKVMRKFGGAVTDIVLRQLRERLEHVTPGYAAVGYVERPSEHAFLVLVPGADSSEADVVGDQIKETICEYELDLGGKGSINFLGCEIGIVSSPGADDLPDELISIARQMADTRESSSRLADKLARAG